MNTGVYDVNGNEIKVGDIVHYRGNGLCAHGKVIEHKIYGFAILDDRPKTKGRQYSLKNEGKYRIEQIENDGVDFDSVPKNDKEILTERVSEILGGTMVDILLDLSNEKIN